MRKISTLFVMCCAVAILAACLSLNAFAVQPDTGEQPSGIQRQTPDKPDGDKRIDDRSDAKGEKHHSYRIKHEIHVDIIKVASAVLEKPEKEIGKALKDGKLGELLLSSGRLEAFKSMYLSEVRIMLDKAVSEGILTNEKAGEKFEELKKKIEAYDGTKPMGGKQKKQ